MVKKFRNVAAKARTIGRRGKTELRSFGSWLVSLGKWSKYLILTVGVILLAGIVALWFGASEQAIRITGMTLQLFGLGTVVYGIDQTRQLFGHPKLLSWPREWLKKFPPYRRALLVISAKGEAIGVADVAAASLTTSPAASATVEQRLQSLESDVRRLDARTDAARKEFKESARMQTEALEKERNQRTAEDTKIDKKLEVSETGGLHISLMGAVWLFFGVMLSGVAPEIAYWLASR